MVFDLVKDAVKRKMGFNTRNDFISYPEFMFGTGYALFILEASKEMIDQVYELNTVHEIREKMKEIILPILGSWTGKEEEKRLFSMVIECKLEGEVTKELKELMEWGIKG